MSTTASSTCKTIDVRKPWSKATRIERNGFLQAVNCTFSKAGHFSNGEYKSRSILEDYALVHNYLSPMIHNGAPFAPCHRQFLNLWIKSLRNECGYQGPILYADWNTYADKNEFFTSTDLWSSENLGTLSCPVSPQSYNGRRK